jgi:hypothetical protein
MSAERQQAYRNRIKEQREALLLHASEDRWTFVEEGFVFERNGDAGPERMAVDLTGRWLAGAEA